MSVSDIPALMRAVVLTGHGGMDKLVLREDVAVPVISDHEVLIKVGACGLNNTDVNTRLGWYARSVTSATGEGMGKISSDEGGGWGGSLIDFPRIQGADVVGYVVLAGSSVGSDLLGKRVLIETWVRDWTDPENGDKCGYFGSECDGGFAEYTKVDWRQVHILESALSDAECATFATSYATAENMLNRVCVGSGDRVLVTGASGGVGSALVQLCKRRGATVIGLAREDKHSGLLSLGADVVFPRSVVDFEGMLLSRTGFRDVDVIVDVVGGDDWGLLVSLLVRGGRYCCSGAIAGPVVSLDLRDLYLKDLTLKGATIYPSHVFSDLVGYISRGEIKPLLAQTYALSDFHSAQEAFILKDHIGNIVVVP